MNADDDRSDEDILQDALAGLDQVLSENPLPQLWMALPERVVANALAPDTITICGKCLAVLKFGDDLAPVVQDRAAIMQWTEDDRRQVGRMWMLAMLARVLGPDLPDDKMQ